MWIVFQTFFDCLVCCCFQGEPEFAGKYFCVLKTYFSGLLVCKDLRVDSVELQDQFVYQLRVQPPVSFEEDAVFYQLFTKII